MPRCIMAGTVTVLLWLTNQVFASLTIGGQVVTEASPEWLDILEGGQDPLFSQVVLSLMQDSLTETFAFNDTGQIRTHIEIRRQIVAAMQQMEGRGINFNFVGGGSAKGALPRDPQLPNQAVFVWLKNPAGDIDYEFRQCDASTLTPAQAVRVIEEQTTVSDCMSGALSAVLIGHRRALGDSGFNGLYGATNKLRIARNGELGKYMVDAQDLSTVIPGDFRTMNNHPNYLTATNNKGSAQKENCICVGPDSYTGLGGMRNLSAVGLQASLFEKYNEALPSNQRFTDPNSPEYTTAIATIKFVTLRRVKCTLNFSIPAQ